MIRDISLLPSPIEISSNLVFSSSAVVDAYSRWIEFSPVEQELLEAALEGATSILDLGCGAGRVASIVPEGVIYIGVDSSSAMVKACRQLYPNHRFVLSDVLEFMNGSFEFDTILLLNNVLDMLHPPARRTHLLSEVFRCLSPGGVLIVSSHLLPKDVRQSAGFRVESYHGMEIQLYRGTHSGFIRELEDAGFRPIRSAVDFRDPKGDWVYVYARRG